jgi:hypothetical protein
MSNSNSLEGTDCTISVQMMARQKIFFFAACSQSIIRRVFGLPSERIRNGDEQDTHDTLIVVNESMQCI